jgi:hypothetical protein
MVSKALAVLFAVLMIPSVVLFWFERDVINTANYMQIVTPLATDPAVQAELASVISVELQDDLKIAMMMDMAAQDLPPRSAELMRALSQPMEMAVDNYVRRRVMTVVGSEEFAKQWEELNREAHTRALTVEGDTVYVELNPIVQAVKTDLENEGSHLAVAIPEVDKKYELFSSPLLGMVKRHQSLIRALMFALPILAVILLAVAVWLSRERFQTVLIAAMSTAAAMLLLLVLTYVGHPMLAPETGGAVYNAFAASLRADIRWVLAISAIIALITWVLKRRVTDDPSPAPRTRHEQRGTS